MIRFDSPWRGLTSLAAVGLLLAPACATPEAAERPDTESGGSPSSEGGSTSSGGASSGASSFGGTTYGGTTSSGGSSDGGTTSSGGSSSGGAATGGTKSTGGVSATGGVPATGGVSATGGSAQGGTKSSGGASTTGGSAQGGTKSTGGASATGGTSSGGSGGAVQGAGGSAGSATGGSGGGGTTCSGAVFCDDFEDGNSSGWTPTGGTWTVTSDGSGVYSGGVGFYFSTAGGVQGNQTVQARMKVLTMSSGSSYRAGIVARYGSSSNVYIFVLDGAGDFRLLKGSSSPSGASSGCDTVASGLGSNVVNTWMTLKMVVAGSGSSVRITTFRDGTAVHDCTTTSGTVANGVGGVMTYGSSTRAEFDDFQVSSP